MKIKLIIFLLLNFIFNIFSQNNNLIQRNLIIFPFYNNSKDKFYDFYSYSIRDNIKSNLINFNIFTFVKLKDIYEKIKYYDLSNDDLIKDTNLKKIALSLKSDSIIFGIYSVSDNKLNLKINIMDLINGNKSFSYDNNIEIEPDFIESFNNNTKNIFDDIKNNFNLIDKSLVTNFFMNNYVLDSNCGVIKVKINKIKNDKGKIMLALFSSADGFPDKSEKAFLLAEKEIIDKKADFVLINIPFGKYGVVVFHDENLNKNYEMLKEGFGASNNKANKMGYPKYKDAEFDFNEITKEIEINMLYY